MPATLNTTSSYWKVEVMVGVESAFDHDGVDLPTHQSIASPLALQLHLAVDRRTGGRAVGMEVGRSVVSLDDGDGATSRRRPPT